MAEKPVSERPRPGEKPDRNWKKPVSIVVAIALVAAAAFAVANRDRLLVHSDISTPPETQPATTTPNTPPEVLSLATLSERIEPFTITEIECVATDPDADSLTYTWSVSAGELFGEGPVIEWGSPTTEGLYRISVTVDDGRGGTAEQSISIRVKANVAPEIPSLTADADWVASGGTVYLSCEATDADGDEVTLEWAATGGSLYGQGTAVVWLAPDEEGVHWITVVALDPFGAQVEKKMSISVTSGEPPEIVELTVEGVNTDLLLKRDDDWHVYRGRSYVITCVLAEESDEFTYEWTLDSFSMAGDGPTTTYVAPQDKATATIAVTVTNQAGNASSVSITVHTETCTCAF
jgi:hypothetical protein